MYKTFTLSSSLAVAAVLLAGSADAQTTIVQSPALHCSSRIGSGAFSAFSWSLGASAPVSTQNSASGSEARAQRPEVGPFNLIKGFDECSPALFQALVTGTRLPTVTVVERVLATEEGSASKTTPVTIQLQGVAVTHYMLSEGTSNAGASESISLVYDRITITNNANGSKFCWDAVKLGAC